MEGRTAEEILVFLLFAEETLTSGVCFELCSVHAAQRGIVQVLF